MRIQEAPSELPALGADDAVRGYVIAGWDSRAHAPGLPRGALRAARHVAEALFSTDDGPPPADRLRWMEEDLGDFFGHVNLRARLLFRACIFACTWVGPALLWRLPPLGRLPVEERVEALERLERTPIGLAVLAAKAILSLVYYEHPDAAAEIGWDRRCLRDRSR